VKIAAAAASAAGPATAVQAGPARDPGTAPRGLADPGGVSSSDDGPAPCSWTGRGRGGPHPGAEVPAVDGDPAGGRVVVRYRRRDGATVGVPGSNLPEQNRLRRPEVAATRTRVRCGGTV
jgi:hypothetical protein